MKFSDIHIISNDLQTLLEADKILRLIGYSNPRQVIIKAISKNKISPKDVHKIDKKIIYQKPVYLKLL